MDQEKTIFEKIRELHRSSEEKTPEDLKWICGVIPFTQSVQLAAAILPVCPERQESALFPEQ